MARATIRRGAAPAPTESSGSYRAFGGGGLQGCPVAAAFVGEEERPDVERGFGADAPRICSTSVNALISAWRRSISLWRLAIACAISLMALESSDPAMGMSTRGGWTARKPRSRRWRNPS